MEGWIKLHRKLLNSGIWQVSTPEQKVVLITLLLMANHSPRDWEYKGQPYTCAPGQLITSIHSIVQSCGKGMTEKKVRNALEKLVKHGVIHKESSTQNTLITLLNWDKYQKGEENKGQGTGASVAYAGQRTGGQEATNKNEDKYKKEKNYNKNTYGVPGGNQKVRKNRFVNFEGRDYDFELYEKMEVERQLQANREYEQQEREKAQGLTKEEA